MLIKNFTRDEIADKLYDIDTGEWKLPIRENDNGFHVFNEFRYFSARNLSGAYGEKDNNFIVAYDENNPLLIYGVLDYGEYGYDERYLALSYIDVNKDYRRQGVARALITVGGELLKEKGIKRFALSHLTDEGQAANLVELCKKIIPNVDFYID